MNAYLDAMRRYATFSGRSTRSQFWLFSLVLFGIIIVTFILDLALGTGDGESVSLIAGLVSLIHLIPQLSVMVRRLHDIDKSGWWVLISFVPLAGIIVLLIFACTSSTPGANRFGPDPSNGTPFGRQQPDMAGPRMADDASIERLEKLAKLHASGAIDDEEYGRMKADLLGR